MGDFADMLAGAVDALASDLPASMTWNGLTYYGVASPVIKSRDMELAGMSLAWDASITFKSSIFTTIPSDTGETETVTLGDGNTYFISSVYHHESNPTITIKFKRT